LKNKFEKFLLKPKLTKCAQIFERIFQDLGLMPSFQMCPKVSKKVTNLGLRHEYLKCKQNILQTFQEISGL
jgi:hypothetical protein